MALEECAERHVVRLVVCRPRNNFERAQKRHRGRILRQYGKQLVVFFVLDDEAFEVGRVAQHQLEPAEVLQPDKREVVHIFKRADRQIPRQRQHAIEGKLAQGVHVRGDEVDGGTLCDLRFVFVDELPRHEADYRAQLSQFTVLKCIGTMRAMSDTCCGILLSLLTQPAVARVDVVCHHATSPAPLGAYPPMRAIEKSADAGPLATPFVRSLVDKKVFPGYNQQCFVI